MPESKDDPARDDSLASMDPTATAIIEPAQSGDLRFLADEPLQLEVEVVGGPMDGKRARVDATSLAIGRRESNDLRLRVDMTVSSEHARIYRERDRFWLHDLQSRNGTYVFDKRLQNRVLIGPGTLFYVGRTCVEFLPDVGS